MGYPSIETFVQMNFSDETSQVDQIFEMAATCVKTIADAEQVYDCSDCSKKELIEFFEQLSTNPVMMIQEVCETLTKLSHTIKVTNPTPC